MPSLWLVDGSHAIFRAYHALPHLSTRQGVPTNAVYGFTTMLLRAIREGEPTHLAVAFDEEAKARRSEIYAEYKATRGPPPDDLMPQFSLVRRVLEVLRVPAIGFPGYEADDVIATLARRARRLGWEVVVVTGDKDLMQLVEPSGNGIRSYVSIYEDLPLSIQLDELKRRALDEPRARALFTELEFSRLVKDLPRPPPTPPSGKRATAQSLAEVRALVERARAAGRAGLFVVTS